MDSSEASSILLDLNSELLDDKDTYAPTATSTSLGPSIKSRKRPRTSWIWSHVKDVGELDESVWHCKHCSVIYKLSGGTHSATRHLSSVHGIQKGRLISHFYCHANYLS